MSASLTFRLYSLSIAWAFVIALLCSWVALSLTPELGSSQPGMPRTEINSLGARTAVAGFGEEALKLLPLAVIALVAPGRMRRCASVDWAVLGFACGLGFLVAEEATRALSYAVAADGGSGALLDFTIWPLTSSDPTGPEDGATWAGHQVTTALVAAGVGVCCGLFRRASHNRSRVVAASSVVIPLLLMWIVVVDHAAANAASLPGSIATTLPSAMSLTHDLTLRGQGRGALLILLFGMAILLDAERVWPVVRSRTDLTQAWGPLQRLADSVSEPSPLSSSGPPFALRWALIAPGRLGVVSALELNRIVTRTHRVAGDIERSWWAIAVEPVIAAMEVRPSRELAHRVRNDEHRRRRDVLARQHGVRLIATVTAAALLLLATLVAAWAAVQVEAHAGQAQWLPGLLDSVGAWWDGLGWQDQAIWILLILALLMFTPLSLTAALFWTGVATYGLSHAKGLSDLVSNPSAAVRSYVDTSTPQSVGVDLLDLGLTFAPTGVAGAGAKSGINQAVRRSVRDHRDTGMALLDPAPFSRIATGVDPTSMIKWKQVPGWLARVRAGTRWHVEQQRVLDRAGGVSELYVKKRTTPLGQEPAQFSNIGGNRVDHYAHQLQMPNIYSMKHTQLADIKEESAMNYLREFSTKYDIGTPIAKKPSTPSELVGSELRGNKVLLVPAQEKAVPETVISTADELDIIIMDTAGRIYG